MAGWLTKRPVDFPRKSVFFGVKSGGDVAEATDAHDETGGIEIGDFAEVGGDGGEAGFDEGGWARFYGMRGGRKGGHAGRGGGEGAVAEGHGGFKSVVIIAEDDVAVEGVERRIAADFSGDNGKKVVVAVFVGKDVHFLGVIAARIGVGGDFLAEFAFEEFFGLTDFAAEEFFVGFGADFGVFFDRGWKRVRGRMAADGDEPAGLQFFDHWGGQGAPAAIDVILVKIDRERKFELFHDGKSVGVN